MRLGTNQYADLKAVTNALGSPDAVFYSGYGDTLTGFWAVWKAHELLVYNSNTISGGSITAVLADFPSSVLVGGLTPIT